jgi:alpha-beta hydrolase superfamily lysophospholipase
MDNWDPALLNGFAQDRTVITFDNAGVGFSSGEVPDTVAAMANHALDFIDALHLTQVDLLGFSLGGYIAQHLTLSRPNLVRTDRNEPGGRCGLLGSAPNARRRTRSVSHGPWSTGSTNGLDQVGS